MTTREEEDKYYQGWHDAMSYARSVMNLGPSQFELGRYQDIMRFEAKKNFEWNEERKENGLRELFKKQKDRQAL